jgi:hypothetical protein
VRYSLYRIREVTGLDPEGSGAMEALREIAKPTSQPLALNNASNRRLWFSTDSAGRSRIKEVRNQRIAVELVVPHRIQAGILRIAANWA